MLTVDEALAAILGEVRTLEPTILRLADALGLRLAEAIVSDIDAPPFDKSLMDGYAVRAADVEGGTRAFDVIEEISAGRSPQREVARCQASRIMTGAPIPAGADAGTPTSRAPAAPPATPARATPVAPSPSPTSHRPILRDGGDGQNAEAKPSWKNVVGASASRPAL